MSTYRTKQKGRIERVIRKVQNSEGCEIVNKMKKGRPRKDREIKGGRPVKEKVDEVNNTKAERKIDNEIKQCAFQMNTQQQEKTCEGNLSGNVSANESVRNNENISFEEDISYEDPGNAQTFFDRCMSELKDDALLMPLVNVLYAKNCLGDFLLLVKQMAARTLPVMNIAFLLCLERARWQSLTSTAGMRFQDVTKKFWCVVCHLLKGKAIRFFSGSKNWGHIISKICGRGRLDPKKSNVNFAVPNERYLRNIDNVMGKIIPPGKIEDSFKLLKGKKNIILMADLKGVCKGLGKNTHGEVNLWGYEKSPNFEERTQEMNRNISFVNDMRNNVEEYDEMDKLIKMKTLLRMASNKIK